VNGEPSRQDIARAREFHGSPKRIVRSRINHEADPAKDHAQDHPHQPNSWPLNQRAAAVANLDRTAVAFFDPDATEMMRALHTAHAEEALGFVDRRATHGGAGRRHTGSERSDRED
jgi:hypothetical protein